MIPEVGGDLNPFTPFFRGCGNDDCEGLASFQMLTLAEAHHRADEKMFDVLKSLLEEKSGLNGLK